MVMHHDMEFNEPETKKLHFSLNIESSLSRQVVSNDPNPVRYNLQLCSGVLLLWLICVLSKVGLVVSSISCFSVKLS